MAILFGTPANDVINGTSFNDFVLSRDGDDVISTGSGQDFIIAGNGDDTIDSGDGSDMVVGGDGDDTIFGGGGQDFLFGNDGNDTIDGGQGSDFIFGGSGSNIITGGLGGDRLYGGSGSDIFNFDAIEESYVSGGFDVISGFQQGADLIDLSDLSAAGIDDFSDISVSYSNASTFLDATSVTGASMVIQISGIYTLTDADFIF